MPAFTSLITDVMRQIGPPLILVIQNLGKEILLLKYPLEVVSFLIFNTLRGAAVLLEFLAQTQRKGFKGLLPSEIVDSIKQTYTTVAALLKQPLPDVFAPDKDKQAKAAKETNDNFEREVAARIDLLKAGNQAAQNEYDKATRDIQLGYAARAISAKEASELQQQAADKLLATLDYNHAAIALLQARDGELESERAAREQEMANQRISNYETILGLNEDFDKSIKKIDADERKADEDKLKRIDKILQGTKDIDAIIKARAVEATTRRTARRRRTSARLTF